MNAQTPTSADPNGPAVKLPSIASRNGGEGNRTPDLVNAIHALSQLSYAPGPFTGDAGVAPTLMHIAGDTSEYDEHAFPLRPARRCPRTSVCRVGRAPLSFPSERCAAARLLAGAHGFSQGTSERICVYVGCQSNGSSENPLGR